MEKLLKPRENDPKKPRSGRDKGIEQGLPGTLMVGEVGGLRGE